MVFKAVLSVRRKYFFIRWITRCSFSFKPLRKLPENPILQDHFQDEKADSCQ